MLEEHAQKAVSGPETTLLGFLEDMERKRGSKGPEAEEKTTKAVLTRFLDQLERRHDKEKVQGIVHRTEARKKLAGILKEMNESQGRNDTEASGNLSEKVHNFLSHFVHTRTELLQKSQNTTESSTNESLNVQPGEGNIDNKTAGQDDGEVSGKVAERGGQGSGSRQVTGNRSRSGTISTTAATITATTTTTHPTTIATTTIHEGSKKRSGTEVGQETTTAAVRTSGQHQNASCASYGCVGYLSANACQCNDRCTEFENCCSDYAETCSTNTSKGLANTSKGLANTSKGLANKPLGDVNKSKPVGDINKSKEQAPHSCAAYGCVGYEPSLACQCNGGCGEYQDCCPDYQETCTISLK